MANPELVSYRYLGKLKMLFSEIHQEMQLQTTNDEKKILDL